MTSSSDWAIIGGMTIGVLTLFLLIFGGLFSPRIESGGGVYVETTISSNNPYNAGGQPITGDTSALAGGALAGATGSMFNLFPPSIFMFVVVAMIIALLSNRSFRRGWGW